MNWNAPKSMRFADNLISVLKVMLSDLDISLEYAQKEPERMSNGSESLKANKSIF